MRPLRRSIVGMLVFAGLLAASCGSGRGGAADDAISGLVATEVGVSQDALDLTLVHELVVDSKGFIYLVGHPDQVTVLDPRGRLVRSIGRQGAGPGEFLGISSIDLAAGDTLLVYDIQLERLTAYAPGRSEPAYSLQLRPQFPVFPFAIRWIGGGRLLAHNRVAYATESGRAEPGEKFEVLRLLASDGAVLRDSAVLLRERRHIQVADGSANMVFFNPFSPRSLVRTAGRERIVTAWSDSLRFTVHSPEGEVLRTVTPELPAPRRPITAAERDSLVRTWADGRPLGPALRRAIERTGITTWPLLHDFTVDDREWIWYALSPPRGAAEIEWTAVDQAGKARERLTLPADARLWTVRGRTAYVSRTDSLDVPRVVVYDLTPAPRKDGAE